ncbi:MAG: iron-sulfur cluster assembly scaffold protein [Novosphingobium sp.]|nr:iron-sulfur cluster assembly scaffold protein [Novosphingobium sp.]
MGRAPLLPDTPRRVLYSPEILGAAVGLAGYPLDPALPLAGEARSRSCGSTLAIRLAIDGEGRIGAAGCRAQACAVGQAAASVFLAAARGRNAAGIAKARKALTAWLTGAGEAPDWPGIDLLDSARAYPARHGAILLAWDAALAALASQPALR